MKRLLLALAFLSSVLAPGIPSAAASRAGDQLAVRVLDIGRGDSTPHRPVRSRLSV